MGISVYVPQRFSEGLQQDQYPIAYSINLPIYAPCINFSSLTLLLLYSTNWYHFPNKLPIPLYTEKPKLRHGQNIAKL